MDKTLTVPAIMPSVDQIMSFVLDAATQLNISSEKYYGLRLAVEEFVVNSIRHGYMANQLQGQLEIRVRFENSYLSVSIIDSAPPFDPRTLNEPEDIQKPAEERKIGGLGVFIALKQADKYQYEYRDGKNINTLSFECPEEVITQMLMSQMNAVESMRGELSTTIDNLQGQIDQMQAEISQLRGKLAEQNLPALSATPNDISSTMKKLRSQAEQVNKQMRQYQDYLRISSSIYTSLELDFVLDNVMFQILELTGASRALLFLREQAGDQLKIEAARSADGQQLPIEEAPYSRNIVETVFTSKQPIMSIDAQQSDDLKAFASVFSKSVRAVICIPLMLHGTAVGVLYADNNLEAGMLDQDLIPILSIFANQVGVAIENARSVDRLRQQTRLEHEIKIAEEIQQDFLPQDIPSISGWSASAYFLPAREVAGDFYDAFRLNEQQLIFVVGDVCDKGLGAALFMALIRSLLRAYAEQLVNISTIGDPADHQAAIATMIETVILKTNNYIAVNHGRSNMFATVVMGIIEPESNTVTYINAGHNPPIVLSASGTIKQTLSPTGPAVGMLPDMPFRAEHLELEAGDFIICYTDGLTEAQNKSGEFFGEARLTQTFQHQPPTSASDAVNRIRSQVKSHIATAAQFDDITLLTVQHTHLKTDSK